MKFWWKRRSEESLTSLVKKVLNKMLPMVAKVTKVLVLIICFLNSLSLVLQSLLHQEQEFKV
jgi:hypothetical protein